MKQLASIATLSLVMPLLSLPAAVDAQRQYRCQGVVRYYPCGQELFKRRSTPVTGEARARPRLITADDGLFAEVTTQTYRPAGMQGWWRGTVRGNGRVHLNLQILRNGSIESTRYMGNVFLRGKSTWFSFKGPVPRGDGWSWNVVASATS
jgi:hypothetical protein